MSIKREKKEPVSGQVVNDRRSGLDRRNMTYDGYIPERRITTDRRFSIQPRDSNHGEWRDRRRYA